MTMTIPSASAAPVRQAERIISLDSLRGIAILGILLMNIPLFAYPGFFGIDPFLFNETGINYYLWFTVLFGLTGTQRALFSMLFGAGILLFIGRKENAMEGMKPADLFFRRQLWLVAISLFDVFILLWEGDILLDYALLGMAMFAFRNLSPKGLIIGACVCLLFMTIRENRDLYQRKSTISKGEAVAAMDTSVVKLTDKQKSELQRMKAFKARTTPEAKMKRLKDDTEIVHGDYSSIYEYRTDGYVDNLVPYLFFELWDVLLCMFLGMAFFKLGILTGDATVRTYAWMTVAGLGIGLALSYYRVDSVIEARANFFELNKNMPWFSFNVDRVGRAVGILGVIMLMYKSGLFKWLFSPLRPVGQMALTNYLGQSLICSIIFNGFGFGLFGQLVRYELYLVVLAVWVFQIIFCNIWMRFFLYGPCEWLWRSLTYWKRQPFLKS